MLLQFRHRLHVNTFRNQTLNHSRSLNVRYMSRQYSSKEASEEVAKISLATTKDVSREMIQRIKDQTGSPGLSVSVIVDGKETWSEGFGYADLENRTRCHPDTVMRIGSVSKSLSVTIIAKFWEEGKLDLDKPVHEYLPEWSEKTFNGQKVDITIRQLLSHTSGIREYNQNVKKGRNSTVKTSPIQEERTDVMEECTEVIGPTWSVIDITGDEFYSVQPYASAIAALEQFENDPLCYKPGDGCLYSTYGWTLISAVIEKISNKKFSEHLKELLQDLGLKNTYLDEGGPIINDRARQYMKNRRGCIVNAPYVDNSNKWAGGGLLSTSRDLAKFGNLMLYSHQYRPQCDVSGGPEMLPGYLQASTVGMMWAPVPGAKCDWDADGHFSMGWGVVTSGGSKYGHCKEVREYVSHTGGPVGGTSALIVLPKKGYTPNSNDQFPKGVVLAMLTNMSFMRLVKTAMNIAKSFE